MSVQAHNCSPERIAGFLERSLSDPEIVSLEDHLAECSACRDLLSHQTAAAELWDKASQYLRDEPGEPDWLSGASNPAATLERSQAIQVVLDSLHPTDDPEMLGRLGSLEIAGVVGAGAMGVVLKAFDTSLDRTVAVKVLAPHLASSGAARKRFAREAKAAAAVLHPNVMAIHSVSNDEALPHLVMPYCRGASLQRRLDQEGPLTIAEILRIGAQIAAGLAAAHAQGLVHRDIKPANILLEKGVERVAITDFGLARAVDDATMSHTGVIAGTPQYMSPEQARGEPIDQRSDLFSLGSVLYAMCTGRSPFRAETNYGVLRRITDEHPRPICDINPEIPEWFCALVAKLMSKRPEDRFESAEELAALLEECLAHVQQPTTARLPVDTGGRPSSSSSQRRHGRAAMVLTGAALVVVMILAGVLIELELNMGKLTIKCDMDGVPVRITQGDKVVEELTVTRDEKSVRIAAGHYEVELAAQTDGLVVKDGTFTLNRGNEHVVTITRVQSETPVVGPTTPRGKYSERWPKPLRDRLAPLEERLLIPSNASVKELPDRYEVAASPWNTTMMLVDGDLPSRAHNPKPAGHSNHAGGKDKEGQTAEHKHGTAHDPDHHHEITSAEYFADEGKLTVPKSEQEGITLELLGNAGFEGRYIHFSAERVVFLVESSDDRMKLAGNARFKNDDKEVQMTANEITVKAEWTLLEGGARLRRKMPDGKTETISAERLELDHVAGTIKVDQSRKD